MKYCLMIRVPGTVLFGLKNISPSLNELAQSAAHLEIGVWQPVRRCLTTKFACVSLNVDVIVLCNCCGVL